MTKNIKLFLFSLLGVGSGAGTWGLYEHSKPRDMRGLLDWRGYKILSSTSDENLWKAVYFENKNALKTSGIENISENTGESDDIRDLKAFCSGKLDMSLEDPEHEEIFRKLIKFCIFNPTSIRSKLISVGKEPASTEEDWKVADALNKVKEGYSSFVSEEGYTALKQKCSANLDGPVTDIALGATYKYCLKSEHSTLRERIQQLYNLSFISDDENWKDKFEQKKKDQVFLDTLNKTYETNPTSPAVVSSTTEKEQGYTHLKSWCTEVLDKKLYDDKVYPFYYLRAKSYCTLIDA